MSALSAVTPSREIRCCATRTLSAHAAARSRVSSSRSRSREGPCSRPQSVANSSTVGHCPRGNAAPTSATQRAVSCASTESCAKGVADKVSTKTLVERVTRVEKTAIEAVDAEIVARLDAWITSVTSSARRVELEDAR